MEPQEQTDTRIAVVLAATVFLAGLVLSVLGSIPAA
jgi:hypothetical protein